VSASRPDGSVAIGTFEEEVSQTLSNVEQILAAAGAARADIVKVNAYLSNSVLFAQFNDIYARHFFGARPARTTLVTSFGQPTCGSRSSASPTSAADHTCSPSSGTMVLAAGAASPPMTRHRHRPRHGDGRRHGPGSGLP
jgi:hypothetical protein